MEEEIELKDLFNIFWKKRFVIIIITIIFAIIGGYYSINLKKPMYKSSTTLLLAQNYSNENQDETTNEITQTDITLNQKLVSTYSELVKSKTVLKQVLENLNMNYDLEDDLKENVTVKEVSGTQVIEITYINENPETAYNVSNELSNVFSDKIKEIYNINNVYIVDKAELPEHAYNINHLKEIIIFAVIGMVISCAIIFIISFFDTTVKTPEDIEKNTNLTVLVQVPEIKIGGKK